MDPPPPPSPLVADPLVRRLIADHRRGRRASIGPAPVEVAWRMLTAGPCWEHGLAVLRAHYDADTVRRAWVALVSHPASGWAVRHDGRWVPYCVPGYGALCGDAIDPARCALPPAAAPAAAPLAAAAVAALPAGFSFPSCPVRPAGAGGSEPPLPDVPWVVDPYVQPCERQEALDRYAWEAIDGPGVAAIAARAAWRAARALRPGASHAELELALASAALAEVQETIRYVPDPPGVEVFQPVEVTIAKGAGDCDKLAAVLAAVDRRLGLVAWPQWVDQRGRTQNHVTTFVVAAGAPRWQDGSVRGARLDEDPWSAAARRGLAGLVGLAPAA